MHHWCLFPIRRNDKWKPLYITMEYGGFSITKPSANRSTKITRIWALSPLIKYLTNFATCVILVIIAVKYQFCDFFIMKQFNHNSDFCDIDGNDREIYACRKPVARFVWGRVWFKFTFSELARVLCVSYYTYHQSWLSSMAFTILSALIKPLKLLQPSLYWIQQLSNYS